MVHWLQLDFVQTVIFKSSLGVKVGEYGEFGECGRGRLRQVTNDLSQLLTGLIAIPLFILLAVAFVMLFERRGGGRR